MNLYYCWFADKFGNWYGPYMTYAKDSWSAVSSFEVSLTFGYQVSTDPNFKP